MHEYNAVCGLEGVPTQHLERFAEGFSQRPFPESLGGVHHRFSDAVFALLAPNNEDMVLQQAGSYGGRDVVADKIR